MNVLEKILEEIYEFVSSVYDCDLDDIIEYQRTHGEDKASYIVQGIDDAVEFIRSHMDGISKTTDVQEVEGIDVDNAIRILKDMQSPKIDYAEMVGAPAFCYGKRYVFQDPEDYAIETALAALNEKKERDVRRAKDTNVPSNDDWIPVEERLPEKTEYYLVQLSRKLPNEDYSDRVVVLYNGEDKEFMCYANLIIAWKPLPESYKPKKNIPVEGHKIVKEVCEELKEE